MTPNPYNEDRLVEQPALALLADLGLEIARELVERIKAVFAHIEKANPERELSIYAGP